MIFFQLRFNSFLALALSATLLVSCLEKKHEITPPKLEEDKVLVLIQKEIALLEADKTKMQERLDSVNQSLEENALRPKMLDFSRREYFEYDKMARQIDQRLDYYKIRKALRENDVSARIQKGLTLKELEQEGVDYEIAQKANVEKYKWRALPALPKKDDGKEKKEGHGEEKSDGGHEEEKKDPPKGGH